MRKPILQRSRAAPSERRGAVLVLALIAVVTVSGLAAGFLQLAAARARNQIGSVDRKRAFYLAESGLAESYVGLRMGKSGVVGTENDPAAYGDGLFWVEVEDVGNDQLALHSTGMVGRARVALDIVVERASDRIPNVGLYTSESLSLGSGTVIDSYDSSRGSWADQVGRDAGLEGVSSIGTGGDLSLVASGDEALVVRGDASWGPSSTYTESGEVYVGGDLLPAPQAPVLPEVELPALLKAPGVVHFSEFPLVVPPGDYALDSLTIGRGSEAVLEGPMVLYVGDLQLDGGARLVADSSAGQISIFVEDNLSLGARSLIENSTEDPQGLILQYAGDTAANIASSGAFHGVLYAPSAAVVLTGSLEIFGSLVANELQTRSGVTIHFDRALLTEAERAAWPEYLTWRLVKLGESGSLSADPFGALGVDRAALSPPGEAHADQVLELSYEDDAGIPQTYTGPESSFDWTDVSKVDQATRDGQAVEKRVAEEPRKLTAEERQFANYIASNPAPADLRTRLLNASPVSETTLGMVMASGNLPSDYARDVLIANSPLSDRVLGLLVDGSAGLLPADLLLVKAAQ